MSSRTTHVSVLLSLLPWQSVCLCAYILTRGKSVCACFREGETEREREGERKCVFTFSQSKDRCSGDRSLCSRHSNAKNSRFFGTLLKSNIKTERKIFWPKVVRTDKDRKRKKGRRSLSHKDTLNLIPAKNFFVLN